jgi:hypothetical protein
MDDISHLSLQNSTPFGTTNIQDADDISAHEGCRCFLIASCHGLQEQGFQPQQEQEGNTYSKQ